LRGLAGSGGAKVGIKYDMTKLFCKKMQFWVSFLTNIEEIWRKLKTKIIGITKGQ